MAWFDLVVRGGTVVEGTGVPRYRADVAVKNGRIVMIGGKIRGGGAKELDASGCIVAPGAVDLHTHYDAQLRWDPYASLSGWFGVTSLTIGQCGFGFAPTKPEDRDANMLMMSRIEAIPLQSMRLGLNWEWEAFPEFLDSLDRQGLGVNVGSLFPFSPLRGYVLGSMPARERTSVTDSELNQMKELFHEGMTAGAFGFSASQDLSDRPDDGTFLPSQVASKEEFLGLAEVLGEFGVGRTQWNIGLSDAHAQQQDLLKQMLLISGRPLEVALSDPSDFQWLEAVRGEGLPVVAQQACLASETRFQLADYNQFDYMSNWVQPLLGTPDERAGKLRDPEHRALMKRDVEQTPNPRTDWAHVKIIEVENDRNRKYEGMAVAEMAELMGKEPLDAFLDLALDEDLRTVFTHVLGTHTEEDRERRMKSPYFHISLSDGGAHVTYLVLSSWPVHFLSHWIRDKEIMTLEQAHYLMSAYPAWLTNFKDRGSIRLGAWADMMVYDFNRLGNLYDKPIYANDFPGKERRLIQKPKGLRYILVNGTVTFQDNQCTGALPGKLLRSYEMIG